MVDKCAPTECTGTVGPNFPTVSKPGTNPCQALYILSTVPGLADCVDSDFTNCGGGFQLVDENQCYMHDVVDEALKIGGANINVYNLLGVHEQSRLVDCTGLGHAVSGGDLPGYPAANAYDAFITEWRSLQRGEGIPNSSSIGYDFGEIRTNDGSRAMYGTDTNVYKLITAISIKQSSNPLERVTRARIERSNDGIKWLGVDIVVLPDDDCLNTILFKDSIPSRYWRIRPIEFNGGNDNWWMVKAIEMFNNHIATDTDNIQDKVLMENRDRDYNTDPITLKAYYDLVDVTTELSQFGIELPSQSLYFSISFAACVSILGRPIIIGDIIEVPSEAQYSAEMVRVKKWLEVVDVGWSTEGYTPGWQPTMIRVIAQPAFVSQETQDIFGDLDQKDANDNGLQTGEDGLSEMYQDFFGISETIETEAHDAVPQRGAEGSSHIRDFDSDELPRDAIVAAATKRLGLNKTGTYVEDAMPPNNAPFSEGDIFPENPSRGDYHRLIYVGLAKDVPARLYRYSEAKGSWVFLEKDKRSQYDGVEPVLQEFLTNPGRVPVDQVTQADRDRIEKDCE